MDNILVANAGSSSVKFQVFALKIPRSSRARSKAKWTGSARVPFAGERADGKSLVDREYDSAAVSDVPAALQHRWRMAARGAAPGGKRGRPSRCAWRPCYSSPFFINAQVLACLERYISLAPLHQPHNLAPIRSILKNSPHLPQVACFDTAFHRDHRAVADQYAIPAASLCRRRASLRFSRPLL